MRVDEILTSFRLLRRINAIDTLELVLATDEQMGYASGQNITIRLESDNDVYEGVFTAQAFKKDGNTLNIIATSILDTQIKSDHCSLLESSKSVAQSLGAFNVDNYVDYPVSLSIEDSTRFDALLELAKITGAEVYEVGGKLIIENAKVISDEIPVLSFHERRDTLSMSTSVVVPKTKSVAINISEADTAVFAKPSLTLAIDYDIHPVSPLSPIVYTKDTQTYTISPCQGRAIIYYAPTNKDPAIIGGNFVKRTGYKVVEKFTLDGDFSVALAGGISEIIGAELDGTPFTDFVFVPGQNTLAWSEAKSGELKIGYKTDVFYALMPPSEKPKKINIKAAHEGLTLSHLYIYDYNGFFPLPFERTISLITDFGLDSNDAIGAAVVVKKNGAIIQNTTADAFGELDIIFTAYGFYCLESTGVTRYITLFANEYSLSADAPEGATC